MKRKLTKKNIILLIVTAVLITSILVFALVNWDFVYKLLHDLITGTEVVKEFVTDRGIIGIIAVIVIVVLCFFFPFIPSTPVQILGGICYGMLAGTIYVTLGIAIASQILYLLKQNSKLFYSDEKIKKQEDLKRRIRESKMGIIKAMVWAYVIPFIPFLVISNIAATGLSYKKYLLFTTFGPIPEVILTLYLGKFLLNTSPVASLVALILLIIIVVLSLVFNDRVLEWMFRPREEKTDSKNI